MLGAKVPLADVQPVFKCVRFTPLGGRASGKGSPELGNELRRAHGGAAR
jgi:hypothetical protein